jgi:hypothetical protein
LPLSWVVTAMIVRMVGQSRGGSASNLKSATGSKMLGAYTRLAIERVGAPPAVQRPLLRWRGPHWVVRSPWACRKSAGWVAIAASKT